MKKFKDAERIYDTEWIKEKWEKLDNAKHRKTLTILTNKYFVNKETILEFEKQLRENGFNVEHGYNTYNVPKLIIKW